VLKKRLWESRSTPTLVTCQFFFINCVFDKLNAFLRHP
jgi:hypothetical protein